MKNSSKKNRGPVIALVALVLLAAVGLGAWFALQPETAAGSKGLTVTVIHGDESSKEFAIRTDAEYLGQALMECEEMGVVGEDGPYGLYIKVVDGEEASDAEQTYWSVALNGEELMVGADSQVIHDGEAYTLTLTTW